MNNVIWHPAVMCCDFGFVQVGYCKSFRRGRKRNISENRAQRSGATAVNWDRRTAGRIKYVIYPLLFCPIMVIYHCNHKRLRSVGM